jgi:hypothetical protein
MNLTNFEQVKSELKWAFWDQMKFSGISQNTKNVFFLNQELLCF